MPAAKCRDQRHLAAAEGITSAGLLLKQDRYLNSISFNDQKI